MPTWLLSTGTFSIEIDTPVTLEPTLRPVIDLLKALHNLSRIVAVDWFKVDQDGIDLTKYTYRFDLIDGRKWRQALFFPSGQEPTMTFNVSDPWKLSEFEPHRVIRDLTVRLIQEHGVTRIHANWL